MEIGGKTREEKGEGGEPGGGMEGNDRFPDKGETFSKGRWNEIGLDPVFESRHRYRWWEVRSGAASALVGSLA